MRGQLEWAGRHGVAGWAQDGGAPVVLRVQAAGRLLGQVVADRYRPDLAAAGEGDGIGAFDGWFAQALPHGAEVAVQDAAGRHVPGSPWRLMPQPPRHARRPDRARPLALVVDEAAPEPGRDAGSAALLSHMQALRQLGYGVVFATPATAVAEMARTAGLLRVAYLHRLRPMLDLHERVRAANPGVRVVYALADLMSLRAARQAGVLGGCMPPGLQAAEVAALKAADVVVTHSMTEAMLLPGQAAFVVPWAVAAAPVAAPFAARRGIGFIGNFGHAPNLDAAEVLLREVMPRMWRQDAALPCVIAGYGMPARLRALGGGAVTMLDSPADAASLFGRVRVTAAPVRFGAGLKGKVLDSLAAGVPCVCSPVAAEGIALPPVLLAEDAAAMAATLWRLHQDHHANADTADAGLAMMARDYCEWRVCEALAAALQPGGKAACRIARSSVSAENGLAR